MPLEGVQAVQQRIVYIQRLLDAGIGTGARLGSRTPVGGFASTLAEVSGAGRGGELGAAERRAPGSYGHLEPPAELRRYGNGRIPPGALVPIGDGSERLYAPAANAFERMRQDAASAGVAIRVGDGYRPYDDQVASAARYGLYRNGGLAAVPGTSNHGWGLALDLDLDARATAWMRENGWSYGFAEDVPREPWHWTYRPAGGVV